GYSGKGSASGLEASRFYGRTSVYVGLICVESELSSEGQTHPLAGCDTKIWSWMCLGVIWPQFRIAMPIPKYPY
ncbi:hypothetical protein AVEN_2264-1, partial [Araneus ventricosus]